MTSVTTDIDNLSVSKSNKLIQVNLLEAKTRLLLQDQKLILSVIGQINPNDDDFKDYQISVNDLSKITGIKIQNLYASIDEACTRLISSVITIKEPHNKDGFLKVTWFSHAEYIPSKGIVNFSVSPRIKPYLLKFNGAYTKYQLKQIMNLKSSYSIRFYELMRQFLPIESVKKGIKKSFREITLDELRGYLGVEDSRYDRFRDFRRFVLEKCQKEITEETDLTFDFEPVRRGRKIHAIKFTIKHNSRNDTAPDQEEKPKARSSIRMDEGLALMLRSNIPDMTDNEMEILGATYDSQIIMESLLDLVRSTATSQIKTTPRQYFYGILKNNNQAPELHKNTLEKLTDRSWDDDGLQIEDIEND